LDLLISMTKGMEGGFIPFACTPAPVMKTSNGYQLLLGLPGVCSPWLPALPGSGACSSEGGLKEAVLRPWHPQGVLGGQAVLPGQQRWPRVCSCSLRKALLPVTHLTRVPPSSDGVRTRNQNEPLAASQGKLLAVTKQW